MLHRTGPAQGHALDSRVTACSRAPVPRRSISEALRNAARIAVRQHGQREIARQVGLSEASVSRFLSGERGLSLESLDRLAEVVDVRLEAGARAKTKPRRP
jgi:transcriptional regulator with XRE-family HTH domain